LTVASTSSWTFTVTWCEPRDLIGLPTMILRLSMASLLPGPATALIAPAMSLTVTAPKSRPP
jgi:hypothetical protein